MKPRKSLSQIFQDFKNYWRLKKRNLRNLKNKNKRNGKELALQFVRDYKTNQKF